MECIIGLATKEFVILAADTSSIREKALIKLDDNKLFNLSEYLVMAAVGDSGDKTEFVNFIAKNLTLYKMKNHYELTSSQAAHYTRRMLAESLRGKEPYFIRMLLGGYDVDEGPVLYFIDYLGSLVQTNCYACCFGGGQGAVTVLDRYCNNGDLNIEQAYIVVEKCINGIQKRYPINLMNFKVQMISKDGIKNLPDITRKSSLMQKTPDVF